METTLLVVVVALLSAVLIILVAGVAIYIRRLDAAVNETVLALKMLREEIPPLAGDARQVLHETNNLVQEARSEVEAIHRITSTVENLVEGRTLVDAAGKAVASSTSTISNVLAGIKEALKTLRHSRSEQSKED